MDPSSAPVSTPHERDGGARPGGVGGAETEIEGGGPTSRSWFQLRTVQLRGGRRGRDIDGEPAGQGSPRACRVLGRRGGPMPVDVHDEAKNELRRPFGLRGSNSGFVLIKKLTATRGGGGGRRGMGRAALVQLNAVLSHSDPRSGPLKLIIRTRSTIISIIISSSDKSRTDMGPTVQGKHLGHTRTSSLAPSPSLQCCTRRYAMTRRGQLEVCMSPFTGSSY